MTTPATDGQGAGGDPRPGAPPQDQGGEGDAPEGGRGGDGDGAAEPDPDDPDVAEEAADPRTHHPDHRVPEEGPEGGGEEGAVPEGEEDAPRGRAAVDDEGGPEGGAVAHSHPDEGLGDAVRHGGEDGQELREPGEGVEGFHQPALGEGRVL